MKRKKKEVKRSGLTFKHFFFNFHFLCMNYVMFTRTVLKQNVLSDQSPQGIVYYFNLKHVNKYILKNYNHMFHQLPSY